MMIDPNHLIDVPPLSVKLAFTLADGRPYEGTGFHVEHQGQAWLVTCRHNVEIRLDNFTGGHDLCAMRLMGESEITFDDDRRVVAISIDGFIPDCAAIELRPGEWKSTPKFATDIHMTVKGVTLPETVDIQAPPPRTDVVKLKPTGWVVFQGFPGGSDMPLTLRGARVAPLPKIIQPWMVTYLPAPVEGFSGGPVLDMTEDHMSLLGITTHRFPAEFSVIMSDGRQADISAPAAACVPIAPLLWATERAGPGTSVTRVAAPRLRP